MNDTLASRADTDARTSGTARVLVWDAPVRVFHWLMVASFAGAWLTAESERWRLVHAVLGYTTLGLVAFRIIWGFAGTRYARFSEFVRSPAAVVRYLSGLVKGHPERHVGHNPAGAIAIVAMLLMTYVVGATGWATYSGTGGEWLGELHEGAANVMLGLVIAHIVAVLMTSLLHRENLIGAMVTGYKPGKQGEGIRSAWRGLAVLLVAAVIGWWWFQLHAGTQTRAADQPAAAAARSQTSSDANDND